MSLPEVIYPLVFRRFSFSAPTRIVFEINAINKIGKEVKLFGVSNVLIVTDPAIGKMEAVNRVMNNLRDMNIKFDVFDRAESEPSLASVEELTEVARKGKFDAIIGIGGGSVMDSAKVASIGISNPGNVRDFIGVERVKAKGAPLICVPTTSGTGSEVSRFAVITVQDRKLVVTSRNIIPNAALLDPMLTVTMPPRVTAGSGMDALSHAIESVLSLGATPLTDALALEAIRLISKYLRTAYNNGRNIEARSYMSLAATISGLAFNNAGLVLGHSVSQTFGPIYKVPHGMSCAMALPYIMEYYLPAVPDKLALIARKMDENLRGLPPRKLALEAIYSVRNLAKDLGVPLSLKEVGVPKEDLSRLTEICVKNWPRPNSPRTITKKSVLKTFERMWKGPAAE
jgi:alcohol dehydrogenase class IV